eukprot:GEMP01072162.1.p1 GENE.GEMP01072162.1~~GEMP01072162.1.p1  ORF type:complete len:152 (+),score=36.12 GEMP01072162.1:146-601(+)
MEESMSELTAEETQFLKEVFVWKDAEATGTLQGNKMIGAMVAAGLCLSAERKEAILEKNSGPVDLAEFSDLVAYEMAHPSLRLSEFVAAFRPFAKADGTVDASCLEGILKHQHLLGGCSPEDVREILLEVDPKATGLFNAKEIGENLFRLH